MSASAEDAEDDIIVATAGIFELEQKTAAAVVIGAPVEMYSDGTSCEDQTIVAGTTSPIGVCVENKGATGTGVWSRFYRSCSKISDLNKQILTTIRFEGH